MLFCVLRDIYTTDSWDGPEDHDRFVPIKSEPTHVGTIHTVTVNPHKPLRILHCRARVRRFLRLVEGRAPVCAQSVLLS